MDLTVPRGQVVALLGPSGCGKTTALRLIAGFDSPDSGTITISGQRVFQPGRSLPPEKRKVGMVFQEGALFPHLTVEQNVAYGLPRGDDRKERLHEVLGLVGLESLRHRMPHELSGGQQQRVALARALAPQPEILLLDEPFSNLDPGLRDQVRRDVREILRASNATAIFVTHDQEEALFVGDAIAVMRQGRIEQVDSPESIFHQPATRFVAEFIGMVDFISAWRDQDRLTTEVGSVAWPDTCLSESELEVMVRPDCLACYPSDQGQGIIYSREFRGAFYLYRVSLSSGRTVRCLLSHTQEYPVGARVVVQLRCGHSFRPFSNGRAIGA
jgi:iron(III) transport system ATP-binding protein